MYSDLYYQITDLKSVYKISLIQYEYKDLRLCFDNILSFQEIENIMKNHPEITKELEDESNIYFKYMTFQFNHLYNPSFQLKPFLIKQSIQMVHPLYKDAIYNYQIYNNLFQGNPNELHCNSYFIETGADFKKIPKTKTNNVLTCLILPSTQLFNNTQGTISIYHLNDIACEKKEKYKREQVFHIQLQDIQSTKCLMFRSNLEFHITCTDGSYMFLEKGIMIDEFTLDLIQNRIDKTNEYNMNLNTTIKNDSIYKYQIIGSSIVNNINEIVDNVVDKKLTNIILLDNFYETPSYDNLNEDDKEVFDLINRKITYGNPYITNIYNILLENNKLNKCMFYTDYNDCYNYDYYGNGNLERHPKVIGLHYNEDEPYSQYGECVKHYADKSIFDDTYHHYQVMNYTVIVIPISEY